MCWGHSASQVSGGYLPFLTCCWSTFSLPTPPQMFVCLLTLCTVAAVGLTPPVASLPPHWSDLVFGPQTVFSSANMVKGWSSGLTAPPNEGCFVQSHIYPDSNNQIPARYSFQWRPQKGEAGAELIPAGERISSAFEFKMIYMWQLIVLPLKPQRRKVFMW